MAKVIELARVMGGLESVYANNDPAMDPGDTRLLEAMNNAMELAVIFVPAKVHDCAAYASVASGADMTGKIVAYTSAIDLTGTPFPSVVLNDSLGVDYGTISDGYAWWHVCGTSGAYLQRWTNAANTAGPIGITAPSAITTSTDLGTGYTGWIHNFCATFGAFSICMWNRNLGLAALHVKALARLMETGQIPSDDLNRLAWPLGQKGLANRGGA